MPAARRSWWSRAQYLRRRRPGAGRQRHGLGMHRHDALIRDGGQGDLDRQPGDGPRRRRRRCERDRRSVRALLCAGGGALVLAATRPRRPPRIAVVRSTAGRWSCPPRSSRARRPAEAAVPTPPLRIHRARRGEGRGYRDGNAAADAMIAARTDDGRFGPFRFTAGSAAGTWRPRCPTSSAIRAHGSGRQAVPDRGRLAVPVAAAQPARRAPGTPRSSTRSRRSALPTARRRTADRRRRRSSGAWRTRPGTWSADLPRRPRSPATARSPVTRGCSATLYLMGADASITTWTDKARGTRVGWPITAIHEAGHDGNPATRP